MSQTQRRPSRPTSQTDSLVSSFAYVEFEDVSDAQRAIAAGRTHIPEAAVVILTNLATASCLNLQQVSQTLSCRSSK